jgi:hypothetical protein
MAEAGVRATGSSVTRIDPDGWCLIACVAQAAHELGDRVAVLRKALKAICDDMPLSEMDADERMAMKREAARALGRVDTIGRHMGTLCQSSLWDIMPHALSRVSDRPLHIYSGNLERVLVNRVVVDATTSSNGVPIELILSCHEYRCAHYDLVRDGAGMDWQGGGLPLPCPRLCLRGLACRLRATRSEPQRP